MGDTKKGNKKIASNYRPVSITSILCRTLEKIIRDSMASFLMENYLISNYQFGFIKGRSTILQLLNMLNDWISCQLCNLVCFVAHFP